MLTLKLILGLTIVLWGAEVLVNSAIALGKRYKTPELLKILKGGESLALISDAGLPAFSDPGDAFSKKSTPIAVDSAWSTSYSLLFLE